MRIPLKNWRAWRAWRESEPLERYDWKTKLLRWAHLLTITLLSAYFAVFMLWLYEVTKPSFMDAMAWSTKVGILLLAGLTLTAAALPVFLLLMLPSLLPWRRGLWRVFLWIAALIPAVLLALTALTMIDNFTYTIFHFGIIKSQGIQRGIYAAILSVLLGYFYVRVVRWLERPVGWPRLNGALRAQLYASAAIVLVSIPLSAGLYASARKTHAAIPVTGPAVRTPNILLIGTDAMQADHMSAYGYSRDTTPFLKTFASQALVSTNNFPNVSISAGSFASIFTGKLPTTTRVVFPPDTLKGVNAVQHFPGILQNQGYYTEEISVDYYADAYQFNLQDGFYTINGRSVTVPVIDSLARKFVPQDVVYFLSTKAKQINDKVQHIFYIRAMEDPLAVVYQGLSTVTDQQRIERTISIFQNAQQPVFVHVYLLGTHMGILTSDEPVYSKGKKLNNNTLTDFYDDSVHSYDQYMAEVVDALKKMGQLEQTIIIVYSDHGWNDVSNVRLPLMMRFPQGEYAGTMTHNTQNLDIAPTLLDYLGIPQPEWMAGNSLLQGEPPVARPIYSAVPNFTFLNSLNQLEIDPTKTKPPFYQFGTVGMAICQNWYSLHTEDLSWHKDTIASYPNPCDADDLPSDQEAQQTMIEQLKRDGFDVSALIGQQDQP